MKETIKEIDKQFEGLFEERSKFLAFIKLCDNVFDSEGKVDINDYLWEILKDFVKSEQKAIEELDVLITKLTVDNIKE